MTNSWRRAYSSHLFQKDTKKKPVCAHRKMMRGQLSPHECISMMKISCRTLRKKLIVKVILWTIIDKEEVKIYQPLIPPRRYETACEEEESVYQGLTLNRSKDSIDPSPSTEGALQSVNDSEGHYQPLLKQAQPSEYETITLHKNNSCSTMTTLRQANNSEGHYQPLMKREETTNSSTALIPRFKK